MLLQKSMNSDSFFCLFLKYQSRFYLLPDFLFNKSIPIYKVIVETVIINIFFFAYFAAKGNKLF